ncbi:MAG: response regulator [Epsilonproteobacteria bacterium]|nr:response regulator [Campylobacterota bacterium]
MLNFTIIQKFRIIFFIILIFFALYVSISYRFTTNTIRELNSIISKKSQIAFLHRENLSLLNDMILKFNDAGENGETGILQQVKEEKLKIENRLNELKKYSNDKKIERQKELLQSYYDLGLKTTKELIKHPKNTYNKYTKDFQDIRNKISQLYINQKINSYNAMINSLKKVSDNTNSYFNLFVFLSIFGFIIMLTMAIYLSKNIRERFEKVFKSLENLSKEKPDFSKKMDIEKNDEIGMLVDKFNQLQQKLEKDYTKINELKIKAEDNAKLKSAFLANMSHEIRTPINGIVGMSYLALQTDLTAKQRRYIEKIENSSKSLLSIINDILDLSKIESGKLIIDKINFDLTKMVNSSVDLIRFQAKEKGLKIKIRYGKNIPKKLYGDSLRISQILTNLLSNAVKFTDSGEVIISINQINDREFRFEVRDTGIGLTQKTQDKLFMAFTQADGSTTRNYGGTGLGLTISKQLVELMNGKIWVESEYGVGSSFIFQLELEKAREKEISKNGTSYHQSSKQSIKQITNSKILLVDDNLINQEIIIGLLEHSNIELDIASNGQEALDMFEVNKYALILMDIQMPIMDGYKATELIRKKDANIPIIALTANAMKEDIKKTAQYGMNSHINKPIDVEKLYQTLFKYIKYDKDDMQKNVYINNQTIRDELFNRLEIAIKSKRPKKCNEIIEEMESYTLSMEDKEIFIQIKNLVKHYKFQSALELLTIEVD